jgi:hypothetical protein
MTDNPYIGTDAEADWQAGYDAGRASTDGVVSPPDDFAGDATAWTEGSEAGYADAQAEASPPDESSEPVEADEWIEYAKGAGHLLETGMAAYDGYHAVSKVYKVLRAGGSVAAAAGAGAGSAIAAAVGGLVLLIELESPPLPTLSEETMSALAASASGSGYTEVFLAVCGTQNHSQTGDFVLDRGFWHGPSAYTSFSSALQDAQAHLSESPEELGSVYVARFAVATPDQIELLQVE